LVESIEIDEVKAVLVSLSQDSESIKLTQKLRKLGVSCVTVFGKPGKALDYANSMGIQFAVFIGAVEIEAKKFKLKDLKSGDERLLSEKQLITKLK
jgi:histidyl-tRNA synthetase